MGDLPELDSGIYNTPMLVFYTVGILHLCDCHGKGVSIGVEK